MNELVHQTFCSDTPQQNGVDERKNCTLLEIAKATKAEYKNETTKTLTRAVKYVIIDYATYKKQYRCFDPIHNQMYTIMEYDFFESIYYYDHLQC